MNLTKEQVEAVESGKAVDVTVEETECILVRKDVYDRFRQLLYDDSAWTHDEMRALLARGAEASGWNEPAMDDYDRYDEVRSKQCP